MSEEMFNPYKLELSRGEMLEQFYQAIMDIDVLGDIKDKLLADDEIEAWANLEVLQGGLRQPPAAETDARGDDLVMLDFDELLTNLSGKLDSTAISILRTYFAAEHSMRTGAEAELASVRSQLAAAEAANERLANALEPFAEAWLQVPYGLRSSLRIWNGELDEDSKYPIIGSISTDTLQDAHTAWAGLPEANVGGGCMEGK